MLMDHQHKKMLLISPSSTTHNWPQIDDEDDLQNKGVMGSTTTAAVGGGGGAAAASSSCSTRLMMEKPGQEQLQQQQQALKCPRCDSSNTKFCYYNNYSLSQPRHFCKACKRYWTRGGTLRNVPVGGGCRKNKRVKRPTSSPSAAVDNNGASSSASSAPPPSGNNNNNSNQQHIDLLTSVANSNHMNPLFYGDHHHLGINNQFMMSSGGRGFDQFSALGLGFGGDHQRLINPATAKQIQDLVSASSLHASNHPIFNSSTSAYGTAPTTMASVLASKFINGGFKDVTAGNNNNNQGYFQNLLPFEDLQIAAVEAGGGEGKEVKVEESRINMGWSGSNHLQAGNNTEQQMGGLSSSTDPTTLYWSSSSSNNNNLGANKWHDPAANLGSSVSSLI